VRLNIPFEVCLVSKEAILKQKCYMDNKEVVRQSKKCGIRQLFYFLLFLVYLVLRAQKKKKLVVCLGGRDNFWWCSNNTPHFEKA
jgi:hypothetical protein